MKDFTFNLDYTAYNDFLNDFLKGKVSMDPDLLLVQALAEHLFRPIVIISTLSRHDGNKILKFNANSEKKTLSTVYVKDRGTRFSPLIS